MSLTMTRYAAAIAAAALLLACAAPSDRPSQPEASSAFRRGLNSVIASKHMAASANPLATEAGREILRAGGSAVDAAIAIQMVLTLVEPQSSGVGGGAFLMHWDGRKVIAYDGRETAPMAADEKLFLLPDGKPMAFTTRSQAENRSARLARFACWKSRTSSTENCPGRDCSSLQSSWRKADFRCQRG